MTAAAAISNRTVAVQVQVTGAASITVGVSSLGMQGACGRDGTDGAPGATGPAGTAEWPDLPSPDLVFENLLL